SGLQGRPDLNPTMKSSPARIVYSASFLPATLPYYKNTNDYYGHGTHVAGILAGNGAMSTCSRCTRPFIGIAPNANIINLRVLDAKGNGTDSSVISAINAAIRLAKTYNIKVINLSLGRPVYESYSLDPLCQAVESAWKSGIVVVVAAGNEGRDDSQGTNGYGTILAPANDPYVISVGAMKDMRTISRSDDLIASYSSKGPTLLDHIVKPDIVAPGNRVISLIQAGSTIYKDSSAAANEIPHSYYMAGSLIAVWDSSPVWGSSVLWGPSIFVSDDKKNVVWGSKKNVVWGSSTTEGFSTLWASSVVWGDFTNYTTEGLSQLINGEN